MEQQKIEAAKHAVDAVSVSAAVGTVVGLLPAVAALFTCVWTGIRIWETKTVQALIRRDMAGKKIDP